MPNPARDFWQSMTQTVTQAVQTVHSRFDWQQVSLRENARTPELWVEFKGQRQVFPLVGDRYVIGRSHSRADIIVDAEIVSGTHARLKRLTPTGVFQIQDLDSTNGIYRKRQRLKTSELHHGDVITLGPPEVKGAVTLRFHNPLPLGFMLSPTAFGGRSASVAL